jgi:hypothetical protein
MDQSDVKRVSSSETAATELTFLFYHYGTIPRYLRNAIEHVRIFNPRAEIMLITDGIGDISMLQPFDIRHHEMSEFPSQDLATFQRVYRHISCFKDKFERFVLERWFVTESVRLQRPERTYIMQDSDVAVFGDAADLLTEMPDCPICLASMNPHFTFIRSSISDFLAYILGFYLDPNQVAASQLRHEAERKSAQLFNQGEMQFLFDYLRASELMQFYETDTRFGFVDCNIHIPQDFDFMQLPRRPRKKVRWQLEGERLIPHFLRDGVARRAFLVHFQGPGKRVFYRFNRVDRPSGKLVANLANILFQRAYAARFL